jgi:hypothetical protein
LATSALTKRFRGHSPLDLSTPGRSAGAACHRGERHTGRVSPVYSMITYELVSRLKGKGKG